MKRTGHIGILWIFYIVLTLGHKQTCILESLFLTGTFDCFKNERKHLIKFLPTAIQEAVTIQNDTKPRDKFNCSIFVMKI